MGTSSPDINISPYAPKRIERSTSQILQFSPDQEGLNYEESELEDDMPQTDLAQSVRSLENSVRVLSEEWTEFMKLEIGNRRAEEEQADSDAAWKVNHSVLSFFKKHSVKIALFLFTSAGTLLGVYANSIRSEIAAQDKAEEVDSKISANTSNIETFKQETKEDMGKLMLQSVNTVIMLEEGFQRIDKMFLKMAPRDFPNEEALPEFNEGFKGAVEDAKKGKKLIENYGEAKALEMLQSNTSTKPSE